MTDDTTNKLDDERRQYYRQRVARAKLEVGELQSLADEQLLTLRRQQATLVERLRSIKPSAEPALVGIIENTIEYMAALQECLATASDVAQAEEQSINLSEGGVGFRGEPPCEIGEVVPLMILRDNDPGQVPLVVDANLVRTHDVEGQPYLGFEFVDLDDQTRRHIVDLEFKTQRKTLRGDDT